MGLEEKLPSGVLLTTVEGLAGYFRKASFWPATFGLACCAIEMMTFGAPRFDSARFGMLSASIWDTVIWERATSASKSPTARATVATVTVASSRTAPGSC